MSKITIFVRRTMRMDARTDRNAKITIITMTVVALGIVTYPIWNYMYFTPVYEYIEKSNHAENKIIYKGTTYIYEYEDHRPGWTGLKVLIGKTNDGMKIYKIIGDNKRIMMTGLMMPHEIYRKVEK